MNSLAFLSMLAESAERHFIEGIFLVTHLKHCYTCIIFPLGPSYHAIPVSRHGPSGLPGIYPSICLNSIVDGTGG